MDALRIVLNLVWLVVVGVWAAIGYAVAGVVCCLLVVTVPWGIASFRIALFTLWPFGRVIERRPEAGLGSTLGNVVWVIVAGWWLALYHLLAAVSLAVTIVGIPFAVANLKLVPISLTPLGRRIVDLDVAAEGIRMVDVGRPAPAAPPVGGQGPGGYVPPAGPVGR